MSVKILLGQDARRGMMSGAKQLADTVIPLMGPLGRNCAYEPKQDLPRVTNQSAVVSQQMEFEDSCEHAGMEILREAANKTNQFAGDGSALTIALAYAMLQEGSRYIAAGANPMLMRKGIQKAAKIVDRALEREIIPLKDRQMLCRIASMAAANHDEVSTIVAESFDKVGWNGIIEVEDSQLGQTYLEHSDGIRFEKGYLSPHFVTDPAIGVCEMENPYILVANIKLEQAEDIRQILEQTSRKKVPLLIITREIGEKMLPILALNAAKKTVQIAAVDGPGHGDTRQRNMQALAAMTGAVLIDENHGLDLSCCGLDICGRAAFVKITKNETVIRGAAASDSEDAQKLRNFVSRLLREETRDYEQERLRTSMSLLNGGIAVIKVGGRSELEMFEKKELYTSAVAAVHAAIADGVLPGGGRSLLMAKPEVTALREGLTGDERLGAQIVEKALAFPVEVLASNAGWEGKSIVARLEESRDSQFGFDVVSGKFCNLLEAGILDPARAVRAAVMHAQSVADVFLTAGAAVLP